jgi:hypothetical protein
MLNPREKQSPPTGGLLYRTRELNHTNSKLKNCKSLVLMHIELLIFPYYGYTRSKGGEIMAKIKCLVEECKYNNSCYCSAREVEVRSNGCSAVSCPDETACETFESKYTPENRLTGTV